MLYYLHDPMRSGCRGFRPLLDRPVSVDYPRVGPMFELIQVLAESGPGSQD